MPFLVGLIVAGVFLWLEAIPSVLAALVFRGGPLWRIFGLVPVTADGRPASRLRFAWRQILVCSPFVAFPILLAFVAPLAGRAAVIPLAIVLVAGVVASTFLCDRSWPDRLAKTWLVVR
jgi:hypothetical protein